MYQNALMHKLNEEEKDIVKTTFECVWNKFCADDDYVFHMVNAPFEQRNDCNVKIGVLPFCGNLSKKSVRLGYKIHGSRMSDVLFI